MLCITDHEGKERELSEIGYTGIHTLRLVSFPWLILAILGLQGKCLDFEGCSYTALYVIPPAVLMYNIFVHARSQVLKILNHHISILTLYGILSTLDPTRISLSALLLFLTLATRFIHKTCVFRMVTHSCKGQETERFNRKNLQILVGIFLLVCKLILAIGVSTKENFK